MLKISSSFFENLKNPLSFEEEKNRKPIIDHVISIYSQFDFEVWESEQEIILIKCQKNSVNDASEFLNNVIKILQMKNETAFSEKKTEEKDLAKIIEEMKADLKYDLNIDKKTVDFLILRFEWNYKAILLETETQLVYFRWTTTA